MFDEILSRSFFSSTSDFSNQNDSLSFWIIEEDFQAINEIGAIERITTNANTKGLTESNLGGLVDSFISQCT